MLPGILGKKIGMTQVYDENDVLHPVTVVQAGPCTVMQLKTTDSDGYDAVQIGFEDCKPHRSRKPQIAHAARAGARPQKHMREIRLSEPLGEDVAVGATYGVEALEGVQYVDVIGTSKGKGFAGVMKRHGFSGQSASHGTEKKHRSPGSIAGHASNAGLGGDIKKGKRMAGHMGVDRTTTRHHKLVGIDKENNLLLIKGPVPGAKGQVVMVRKSITARVR
ncbi:MAG: 50S ribosomal protein L3 [Phycisphaerae bacterium]